MGRGEDDDDVGTDIAQLPGQLDAAHTGHVHVQHGEIHRVFPGVGDGLQGVCEFADDLEFRHVCAFELKQPQVEDHIVDQNGSHGLHLSHITSITKKAYENRTLSVTYSHFL